MRGCLLAGCACGHLLDVPISVLAQATASDATVCGPGDFEAADPRSNLPAPPTTTAQSETTTTSTWASAAAHATARRLPAAAVWGEVSRHGGASGPAQQPRRVDLHSGRSRRRQDRSMTSKGVAINIVGAELRREGEAVDTYRGFTRSAAPEASRHRTRRRLAGAHTKLKSGRHCPAAKASPTRPATTAARGASPFGQTNTLCHNVSSLLQKGPWPSAPWPRCLSTSPVAKEPARAAPLASGLRGR